jgi:hypothetical protein
MHGVVEESSLSRKQCARTVVRVAPYHVHRRHRAPPAARRFVAPPPCEGVVSQTAAPQGVVSVTTRPLGVVL